MRTTRGGQGDDRAGGAWPRGEDRWLVYCVALFVVVALLAVVLVAGLALLIAAGGGG